jgi:hypothetical protein
LLVGCQNRSSHGTVRVITALKNMTGPKAFKIKFWNPGEVPPA